MGPEEHGGHCELVYEDMKLPAGRVILGEGLGLKITQMRLGPARLTHCNALAWSGQALRRDRARIRAEPPRLRRGGCRTAKSIQIKLGDLAMGIEMGRLLVMKGGLGSWIRAASRKKEVSMAKIHVGEPPAQGGRCGDPDQRGTGLFQDTVLEWIYRYGPAGASWWMARTRCTRWG